jgi:hypothetical protein
MAPLGAQGRMVDKVLVYDRQWQTGDGAIGVEVAAHAANLVPSNAAGAYIATRRR